MKFFLFLLFFIVYGCNNATEKIEQPDLWEYKASMNDTNIDQQLAVLVDQYLSIYNGFIQADTLSIKETTLQFIQYTDSIMGITVSTDSIQQAAFVNGLINIKSEAAALLTETTSKEINFAFNMLSIQMLHLLGEMGYQKNSLYIFTETKEDPFIWFGITKTSKNPFGNEVGKVLTASKVLQE